MFTNYNTIVGSQKVALQRNVGIMFMYSIQYKSLRIRPSDVSFSVSLLTFILHKLIVSMLFHVHAKRVHAQHRNMYGLANAVHGFIVRFSSLFVFCAKFFLESLSSHVLLSGISRYNNTTKIACQRVVWAQYEPSYSVNNLKLA